MVVYVNKHVHRNVCPYVRIACVKVCTLPECRLWSIQGHNVMPQ